MNNSLRKPIVLFGIIATTILLTGCAPAPGFMGSSTVIVSSHRHNHRHFRREQRRYIRHIARHCKHHHRHC